jgi:hypothetical protein
MAAAIDRLLQILKWPVALAFVALLPGTLWAFASLLGDVLVRPNPLLPFLGGFFLYLLLWWLLFRRPGFGSLLSTFEHELTHALFAWLTLHHVVGLRVSWREGGEMQFRGRGNWLIAIAPYFFPTASVAATIALALLPASALLWMSAVLGLTVSYHLTSTWLETHRHQPDLEKVGFPFAIAFLPTANLALYGAIVAFAYGGVAHLQTYTGALGEHTAEVWGWVGRQVAAVVAG